MANRDLQFLFEIGTLKNVQRGWRQHMGMDVGTVLEHTMRVVFLALLIARKEQQGDENKIIKMALVHDLAEARVSDHSYVQKVYVKADEEKAARDMFRDTTFSDLNKKILKEYEERKTIEAKIVKDADNLEVDLELKELIDRGSKLAEKFLRERDFIPEQKLYTQTAKDLWYEIAESDIHEWHSNANKWVKVKNAGK